MASNAKIDEVFVNKILRNGMPKVIEIKVFAFAEWVFNEFDAAEAIPLQTRKRIVVASLTKP